MESLAIACPLLVAVVSMFAAYQKGSAVGADPSHFPPEQAAKIVRGQRQYYGLLANTVLGIVACVGLIMLYRVIGSEVLPEAWASGFAAVWLAVTGTWVARLG